MHHGTHSTSPMSGGMRAADPGQLPAWAPALRQLYQLGIGEAVPGDLRELLNRLERRTPESIKRDT